MRTHLTRPRILALAVGAVAVVALVLPAAGKDQTPTAGNAGTATSTEKPGNGPKAEKPGKGPKTAKAQAETAEQTVTVTGTVGTRTGEDGETTYTLTVGTTVYDIEAGPPWWWGDKDPLKPYVGKDVEVQGEQAEGSTSIDVFVIDGTTIREPGKPPWAGGWKVVGEKHPGWAQWKADKAAAKVKAGHGRPSWAGPKATDAPGG